jgi:hypothetical protein
MTNEQIINLWRSLLPSIKKEGNKLTIKNRSQTFELPFDSSRVASKSSFTKNNQYR